MSSEESPHVLVVDDSAPDRAVAVRILRRLGCRVTQAPDGEKALKAMCGDTFKAVFLDLTLPKMDGLECIVRYRAWEAAHRKTRQFVCCATGSEEITSRQCLAAGMDEVIMKPYTMRRITMSLDMMAKHGSVKKEPGRKCALVIDDNAMERLQVSLMLTRHGFAVTEASDGAAGLEEMQQQEFTMVILDATMPGLDGLEVVFRLRAWEQVHRPHFRQYVCCAVTNEDVTTMQCLEAGMDDVIRKPFSDKAVRQACDQVLPCQVVADAIRSTLPLGMFRSLSICEDGQAGERTKGFQDAIPAAVFLQMLEEEKEEEKNEAAAEDRQRKKRQQMHEPRDKMEQIKRTRLNLQEHKSDTMSE